MSGLRVSRGWRIVWGFGIGEWRMHLNFVVPVVVLAGLTLVAGSAWWFMARRPARWAAWVDGENDFWQARGIVSASLAERMKRWEKGRLLRWMAAGTTVIGVIGLGITMSVLVKVVALEHQRVRMPFNPMLQMRPVKQA